LDQNNGEQNSQTANITLSLVTFSDRASIVVDKTASLTDFIGAIPTEATGGTNWEDALKKADNIKTRTYTENGKKKNATKYVIFVSDGDPTFRNSSHYYYGWNPDDNRLTPSGIHGSGNSDDYGWNYADAAKVAGKIGSNFYGLGVFGNVENMQNLVSASGAETSSHYFSVNNSTDLQTALSQIAKSISNSADFRNVTITDNITNLTSTALVNGNIDGMTVKVTDNTGKDATSQENVQKPSYTANQDGTGQKVTWSLGSNYHLKDGYTYSVTFKVWPSQEAYDTITKLNNGETVEGLTFDADGVSNDGQIVRTGSEGSYSYSLRTNTSDGNTVTYTRVDTKTENGKTTTSEESGSVNFTNPDPVALHGTKLQIKKVWADSAYTNNRPDSITMQVKQDGSNYKEVTLTGDKAATEWTAEVYIAPGIYVKPGEYGTDTTGENAGVLESGHTYTVEETGYTTTRTNDDGTTESVTHTTGDYHYELSFSPVRPMMNGATTNDTSDLRNQLNNEVWTNNEAVLTATNTLRGGIEISKRAFANDGTTDVSTQAGVKDTVFTFKLDTLTIPTGYSLTSTASNYIGDDYVKDGKFAVWYTKGNADGVKIAAGETFTLKPGESVILTNVPIGTTYSISEETTTGYELFQVRNVTDSDNPTVIKGSEGNNVTVAAGTTTGNTQYDYEFDNKQKTTSIVIKKTTEDYETLLGGSTFTLSKKNAKGTYAAVSGTYATLNPDVTNGVKLEKIEVGDYKITETHAPDGYIVETSDTYFSVGIGANGEGTITFTKGQPTNEHAKVDDNNSDTLLVGNKAGQALPNTGGHGTLPYTVGGMFIVLAAGTIYLISKKRLV
jgi:LPXTG-motif cell wall-anchored protein